MRQRPENRVQNFIESLPNVLRQKSQCDVAVFLKHEVFPAIAPVGVGVAKMLAAVQFHAQRIVQASFELVKFRSHLWLCIINAAQ